MFTLAHLSDPHREQTIFVCAIAKLTKMINAPSPKISILSDY
jgi:hypothetical protein